jgi:Zn-dependent peptidase ImmA (M78 family)
LAWKTLRLEPPADLILICKRLKIVLLKKLIANDILGVYVITPEHRHVVTVNKGIKETRQRFTLAHEIGHHLMLAKDVKPGIVCKLREQYTHNVILPEEERRANRFASSLLMPHWYVKEWYKELASNKDARVPVMADRFGVTLSAMSVRLRELGLRGRNRIEIIPKAELERRQEIDRQLREGLERYRGTFDE